MGIETGSDLDKVDTSAIAPDAPDSRDRREALVTLGKYSLLTAPTVASLLVASPNEAFGGSAGGKVKPVRPVKPPKPVKPAKPKKGKS